MKYFVPGDEDIIELNEIFQEALLIGEERYKHLLSFVSSIETVLITIPEILT